jgi:ribonuclease-3
MRKPAAAPKAARGADGDPGPLEARLGYRFRDGALLERALTHASRAHEGPGPGRHNEPLEFLGDAVLGAAIARALFDRFPDSDEGGLSRMKAFLVSRANLAAAARRLDLGPFLRLGRAAGAGQGRERDALLADTLEALIGAIHVDGGEAAARAVTDRLFGGQIAGLRLADVERRDHKTALQEWLQARGRPTPEYRVTATEGPAHRPVFLVGVVVEGREVARGRGGTKKEAEQKGARLALRRLRQA